LAARVDAASRKHDGQTTDARPPRARNQNQPPSEDHAMTKAPLAKILPPRAVRAGLTGGMAALLVLGATVSAPAQGQTAPAPRAKAPRPAPAAAAPALLPLRAGAAKVDITPRGAELIAPFTRVNDDIAVRTLVVEAGPSRAVFIVADVPMFQAGVMAGLVSQVARMAGVPEANVLLSASHTHNTIRVDPNPVGIILPGSPVYTEKVSKAVIASVESALASLRPAQLKLGEGQASLVGGKNAWSPRFGRVVEGVDRTGADTVNRKLGVMTLVDGDGAPIALLLNYAINPVIAMAMKDAISGDVIGATSRHVEERFGKGVVALFTTGASGNPLYRADAEPGMASAPRPAALIEAYATILGEEAIAVSRESSAFAVSGPIAATLATVTCPGKLTSPFNLPDRCAYTAESKLPPCDFKDKETDPVALKMGVIRLGPLAIVQSDSDVNSEVGLALQRRSPLARTWIATTNFGPMRYVVPDRDYVQNTYEATATSARRGCAEQGYTDTALRLITSGQ
jgi:hypothetical protein